MSRHFANHLHSMQWLCVSFLFFSSLTFAQTTSTTILGTVTDTTSAVLPNAKVVVTNTGTGQRREALTSSTGDFSFPLLDVGVYDVIIEAAGFKQGARRSVGGLR